MALSKSVAARSAIFVTVAVLLVASGCSKSPTAPTPPPPPPPPVVADPPTVACVEGIARATTNADGLAGFTSIMPGWYSGRAPHIHVHVYTASGTSLLVTQIAFPTDVCDTIYTTANNFYTKGKQNTANTADNTFSDSLAKNLGTMTGNITDGYVLEHTVNVAV